MDNLHRELLIEHYKNPQNFGKIEGAEIVKLDKNPLCGDTIEYYLKLGKDKQTITDAKFQGKGCSICMASASMLSEELPHKKITEVQEWGAKFVKDMIQIKLTPPRLRCAMLSLMAVKKGIIEYQSKGEQK